ncbi:MAG: SDR family oxidoreductase [Alphaproteobacteria bacterium]|nr:SDR family oxidoreductase [Alphaproteobacteria bacterium]
MRVFLTGGSGWIGSALVPQLRAAGHEVVGLARSEASAAALAAAGAEPLRGDLADTDALGRAAARADGVIHLAFGQDFSRFQESVQAVAAAIAAWGDALAGTGKPLVLASGTPAIPGRVATERDRSVAAGPAAARDANARAALALKERGVRASIVRLPRSVHGAGERHGFLPRLVTRARASGVSGVVGDGAARWPAVHVQDAARLFRLALEGAPAGAVLHAVGDEGVPMRAIAEVIGRHLDRPVASVPAEDFGFLGRIFGTDQPASSALTRALLGWQPTHPGLLDDLDQGHYFD